MATLVESISRRRDHERELALRWRTLGDERARDELLERMMPMVHSAARRYARASHDVDDLVQVASIGVMKAIDRFEPERGFMLSTYASSIVVGEIKRYFRDSSWAVKVPRGAKEMAIRLDAALPKLTGELGRSPTVTELANSVGADHESVLEALEARSAASVASLDQAFEDHGESSYATLAGVEEEGFDRVEQRSRLEPALKRLSSRERIVLALRFEDGLTQAEIAERVGVSQMQVSRILRGALERAAELAA
jgi:RNA polymerase sigma-B factor